VANDGGHSFEGHLADAPISISDHVEGKQARRTVPDFIATIDLAP
jgi:hypothetical protein